MKRILVFYNWQLTIPFYGIMIDHIKETQAREGVEIHLLGCDGIIKNCINNRLNDPKICSVCRFVKHAGFKEIKGNVFYHELDHYKDSVPASKLTFEYNSVEEIKRLKYKDVQIGYGALSSYVSYTRNLEPIFNEEFVEYFDKFLESQVFITDVLEYMDGKWNFDEVILYNGRWADVRPAYDFFNERNVKVQVLESINNGTTEFDKEVYYNVLPQNISNKTRWIEETWVRSSLSEEEKIKSAESYYRGKREGKKIRPDVIVFTAEQDINRLPGDWDANRMNIVIFNSSEDEFIALGQEWEKYRIFQSQEQGIKEILEKFANQPNIHFYLRNHPNLKNIKYGYVQRIFELESKYSNITVIPPDSEISTYGLIDACDQVVTFGSSVGIEANFFNKPVILLGGTIYYELDVAYIPKTRTECFNLIGSKLPLKPKIGALKFAFFILNYSNYAKRISMNPVAVNFFGITVGHVFDFLKLWNSRLLFRIIFQMRLKYVDVKNKISGKKTKIPDKGL